MKPIGLQPGRRRGQFERKCDPKNTKNRPCKPLETNGVTDEPGRRRGRFERKRDPKNTKNRPCKPLETNGVTDEAEACATNLVAPPRQGAVDGPPMPSSTLRG